jgi:hypothetical protein
MNFHKLINGIDLIYRPNTTIAFQPNKNCGPVELANKMVAIKNILNVKNINFIEIVSIHDIMNILRTLLTVDAYLYTYKVNTIDYLVPFLGLPIIYEDTKFFEQNIFKYSSTSANKKLFKLNIIKKAKRSYI